MKNLKVLSKCISYAKPVSVCIYAEISSEPHTFEIKVMVEAPDGEKSGVVFVKHLIFIMLLLSP